MSRVSAGLGGAFMAGGAALALGEAGLTVEAGSAAGVGCLEGRVGREGVTAGCTGDAACPRDGVVPAVPGLDPEEGSVCRGAAETRGRISCCAGMEVVAGVNTRVGTETSFLLCRGALSNDRVVVGDVPVPAVPGPVWWTAGDDGTEGVAGRGLSCGAGLGRVGALGDSVGTGAPFLLCRGEGPAGVAEGADGLPAEPGRLTGGVAARSARDWLTGEGRAIEGGAAFAVPWVELTLCRTLFRVDWTSETEACSLWVLSELVTAETLVTFGEPAALGRAVKRVV